MAVADLSWSGDVTRKPQGDRGLRFGRVSVPYALLALCAITQIRRFAIAVDMTELHHISGSYFCLNPK